jgi:hypothetical protein
MNLSRPTPAQTPRRARLVQAVLLILMLLGGLARPQVAMAAPGVSGVQPGQVSNANPTTLVISGTGFETNSIVILETYGALDTTFVSDQVLRADLPSGVAPGSYSVTVVNPDNTSATLPNALTVTAAVTATPAPNEINRPLLVIDSYGASVDEVVPGQEFNLVIRLHNVGQQSAINIVATFAPGDFTARVSGGIQVLTELDSGDKKRFNQPLTASFDIIGKRVATVVMTLRYTDLSGAAYTETFNITLPVAPPSFRPTATPTPTPTAAPRSRPQMVIEAYSTNLDTLQPGSRFMLEISVRNVGNAAGRGVTMILGGGSGSSGGAQGTPDPGGVSGGSGDFGNFAPVNSSNVQFLGDLDAGGTISARAALIVNASANPGAYPVKISFTYTAPSGNTFTDDQVITLLIYSPPVVDVSFYRDPGVFFSFQPSILPLQVVNLGRRTTVLGSMTVSAVGAQLQNSTSLVGNLDPGGYFTLDTQITPDQPGPVELTIILNYNDDFNSPRTITRTLTIEVQESAPIEPPVDGNGGEPIPPVVEETLWDQILRFLRGLLGLDSGTPQPAPGEIPPGEIPPEGQPLPGPAGPVGPKG